MPNKKLIALSVMLIAAATAGAFIPSMLATQAATSSSTSFNLELHCPPTATVGVTFQCIAEGEHAVYPVTGTFTAQGSQQGTGTFTITGGVNVTFSLTYNIPGTFTINIAGSDNAGRTDTDTGTIIVTGTTTPPPHFTLELNCPATATVGQTVTCTATPTGAQGPVTFTFAAPAGTPPASVPGSSNMFTTSFPAPGQMTVIVVGTDTVGVKIEHATVTVTSPQNQPPPSGLTLTSFTVSPQTITAGQPVTFTATFTGGTGQFNCVFTFMLNSNGGSNNGGTGGGHDHNGRGHHHHEDNGQGDDTHHTGNDKNGDTGDSNNNGGPDPSCSTTTTFQHAGTLTANVLITDQNGATITGTMNTTIHGSTGGNSGGSGGDNGSGGCNCCCCCNSCSSSDNSDP